MHEFIPNQESSLRIIRIVLIQVVMAGALSISTFGYEINDREKKAPVAPIAGFVKDETGQPLPGVNVIVKGTTVGTTTDAEGKYTLEVPDEKSVLVFSFIGYNQQEVVVGNRSQIDVTLTPDITTLSEVIVVGYGTMKKSDVTGAVERADLKALENSAPVNAMEGLKGVIPGLNIGPINKAGDNPTITIRGRNSISGNTGALIVLDGIIYRGSFTDINPADIESVDVLKDASSAAIYGSQAANGVILITTKTAKTASKPIIEYSGNYSMQRLINNDMKRLNRDGFLNQLADVYIQNSRTGTDLLQRNPGFDVASLFRDEAVIAGYAAGTDTDWWDLLSVDNPYIQNHNLSIRGKNDLSSYFLSFGYTDQQSLVKNDTYQRYGIRVNLDANITDWLTIGTQSFFTISDFSGNNTGFASLNYIPALSTPYNADGSLKNQVYLGAINPLLSISNPDKDVRNNLTGNFYAQINIPWIKGLSYRMNYSNNLTTYRDFNFDPYANSLLGFANKRNSWTNAWTLDNIVTYKRDFGLHSINGTFVYGVEERNYETTNVEARNFSDKTLGYNVLQAGQADLNVATADAWKETSLYTMVRAVYSYNNRYIFTGTIRRDGFSGFSSKNKFGTFPSAAVAWNISQENFMADLNWIDDLKIRYSYGQAGNRTIGRYATLAQMSGTLPAATNPRTGGYLFGDGATGELTQAIRSNANAGLKWETTTSSNIGIDFTLLNARLSGSYNFYSSTTSDLLYNISVPSINGTFPDVSGSISVPTNIGKLKNSGHELSVTGIPVATDQVEWSVTANFATNRNKVETILGNDANGDGKEDDLIASNIFIGQPLGTIYNYDIIGMWQVADVNAGEVPAGFTYGTYKIADIDGDGFYTPERDRKIIGHEDPLYTLSFINTVKYKNFELKAFIYSIQGGKDYYLGQPASQLPIPDHLTNNSYFKFDYWTPENPNAKYRQLGSYTPSLGADFSPYVSRSFVRLQELSLAYNLPSAMLSKLKISRAKVWVSAFNLFTITKWDGWDPEANQGLTYDLNPDDNPPNDKYPTMKRYTIGVNFAF
jgi:TonB-linked SusC/RagA family outer membrane protein